MIGNLQCPTFLTGWGEGMSLDPTRLAQPFGPCFTLSVMHWWPSLKYDTHVIQFRVLKDCACNFKLGAREGGQWGQNLPFPSSFKQNHVSDRILSSALCFLLSEMPFHQLYHYWVPPDVLWSAFLVLPVWVPLYGPLGYVSIWSESLACGQSPPKLFVLSPALLITAPLLTKAYIFV